MVSIIKYWEQINIQLQIEVFYFPRKRFNFICHRSKYMHSCCQSQNVDYISLWHLLSPCCRTSPYLLSTFYVLVYSYSTPFQVTHLKTSKKYVEIGTNLWGIQFWTSAPLAKINKMRTLWQRCGLLQRLCLTAGDHLIPQRVHCL